MPTTKFTSSGGVTAASRKASEKAGHTMKGGSFPINNSADLARAKHDVGRAKNPAAARRWINKRAQDLGEPKLGKASGGSVQTVIPDDTSTPAPTNPMRDPSRRIQETIDRAAIQRGRSDADARMAFEGLLKAGGKARGGQVDGADIARSRYVASRGGQGLAEGGEVRHGMMGLKALFTKRASHEDREPKRKSRWG